MNTVFNWRLSCLVSLTALLVGNGLSAQAETINKTTSTDNSPIAVNLQSIKTAPLSGDTAVVTQTPDKIAKSTSDVVTTQTPDNVVQPTVAAVTTQTPDNLVQPISKRERQPNLTSNCYSSSN